MSLLTKEIDLQYFINQKKTTKNNDNKMFVIKNIIKLINSCIIKLYDKHGHFHYINPLLDIINKIFWILYDYSNNLKLSMFLCERCILLYSEYLVITTIDENQNTTIKNAIKFVYKKTVGPIIVKLNPLHLVLQEYTNIIVNHYKYLVINFKKNYKNYNDIMTNITKIYYTKLYFNNITKPNFLIFLNLILDKIYIIKNHIIHTDIINKYIELFEKSHQTLNLNAINHFINNNINKNQNIKYNELL